MSQLFDELSGLLARAARDRQLTRGEQISVVMVGHLGVLAGVALIRWAFDVGEGLPGGFLVGEGIIIVACGILTIRVPEFQSYLGRAGSRQRKAAAEKSSPQRKESAEKIAGFVLIAAFIVQFAALTALLWETGGPIESPFAELTLAIAVFTPFLANNSNTVLSVVAASIIYYALVILVYGNTHPEPKTILQVPDTSDWAYFWVNVMILLGAITFTIFESLARSWQAKEAEDDAADAVKEAADDIASNGTGGEEAPTDETPIVKPG
ncbi:MAG TPA: hypothetical protein VNC16_02145 [Solirubrobacterales bacterium]|jgi:hypothetical protein|nr:hypothetical protein [Solirubrobacterales bacterium]